MNILNIKGYTIVVEHIVAIGTVAEGCNFFEIITTGTPITIYYDDAEKTIASRQRIEGFLNQIRLLDSVDISNFQL